jgi:hypothetical protein
LTIPNEDSPSETSSLTAGNAEGVEPELENELSPDEKRRLQVLVNHMAAIRALMDDQFRVSEVYVESGHPDDGSSVTFFDSAGENFHLQLVYSSSE